VCILSTSSISGVLGADYYCFNPAYNTWSTTNASSSEQESIFLFMKNATGLGLTMTQPDA
jgi:hypothetical protein